MSGLPPYQNQAQVSPEPYQNSMNDKSLSPVPSPVQSPTFTAQGPPPPQVYAPGQPGPAPLTFAPQMYPYNADSLTTDITQCKEPKLARCKSCNFIVMTRVEKKVSICQLIIVILMFCSIYLIVSGIFVLIFCSDYEHFCTRCQSSIGRKKGCCC